MSCRKVVLFFIFFIPFHCYSQQIENVDFTAENNIIVVTYDLVNCPPKSLYDIKIKFTDENKGEIYPTSITGDLKKVSSGKNKRIEWNVLNDKTELKGNIQAIVEISKKYSTKITGGPSNAFLSMLLPGLGDYFVNKDKEVLIKPYYVTLLFAGSVYLAYSSKVESDKYYKAYHSATLQTQMDDNYKKANDNYQIYQFFLGTAAAIWLGDVIYVTVKGFKNRREQLGYSYNNSTSKFYFVCVPNNYQIGFVKHF